MYFPVADITISPFLPPLIACVISFFTSMAGVSGAFLLLPFQVSVLGFTSPSVSATNHLFNVTAIPSGVLRFIKEGRMIWPLTWVVIIGTLPGVFLGSIIRIRFLPDPAIFKLFAGFVLLYIGIKLSLDLLKSRRKNSPPPPKSQPNSHFPPVINPQLTTQYISYEFNGEKHKASTAGVLILSLIVGLIGGTYGIGGGAIIAPFLVTIYRLPIHTIAGATLMGTFITSLAGVLFFQFLATQPGTNSVAPDYLLGILFGIGGAIGIYLGARFQRFFPATIIKITLCAILLMTSTSYIAGFWL